MRMASSVDHLALVDGVTAAVLAQSVPLGDWCESAGVVTLALEGGAESR